MAFLIPFAGEAAAAAGEAAVAGGAEATAAGGAEAAASESSGSTFTKSMFNKGGSGGSGGGSKGDKYDADAQTGTLSRTAEFETGRAG